MPNAIVCVCAMALLRLVIEIWLLVIPDYSRILCEESGLRDGSHG